MDEDNADNYQKYLAYLISQTKSRGNGKYYNQHINKCREQAAAKYPIGSKDAKSSVFGFGVALWFIFIVIAVIAGLSKHHR